MTDRAAVLDAVARIVDGGDDADEVLRTVLAELHGDGIAYAAIRFVEGGRLVPGPSVGAGGGVTVPVRYDGDVVGELEASVPAEERPFLERVAELVAAHVLVGWDTGGEPWQP